MAIDEGTIRRGIWLNSILLSMGFGLCCGLGLMLLTFLSLAITGDKAGYYLNLLGVFMPGYSVSPSGAWIGLFGAFIYGAISGLVTYQVYARTSGVEAFNRMVREHTLPRDAYRQATMRLSGKALGLALGLLLAGQLWLSSAWLIVRGTAAESKHAALLAHYLPGYSVSFMGAAIGAFWLFVYVFVSSFIFAQIYNRILDIRKWRGESQS